VNERGKCTSWACSNQPGDMSTRPGAEDQHSPVGSKNISDFLQVPVGFPPVKNGCMCDAEFHMSVCISQPRSAIDCNPGNYLSVPGQTSG
jgi:hypothetical protein